ncbi:MAG: ABC transporter permease [Pseudomonadota bacterium]
MLAVVIERIGQALISVMVVALIAFVMVRFVGDPVEHLVGLETTLEDRAALRVELGLDRPMIEQFVDFIVRTGQLDLGRSYQFDMPVLQLFAERLPATLELALIATALSILIGLPAGIALALHRDHPISKAVLSASLLGISLPTFFVAIVLTFIFSVKLQVLPAFGRGEVIDLGGWTTGLLTVSGLKALVLPATTLALFQIALIVRLVRGEMIDALAADHIRFAHARGLPDRIVHFRHGLRSALVPIVTLIGLQLGTVVAFAIVTETVFQWPGLGRLFFQAVQTADIPVMAAYLVFTALLFILINLAVDLLYVCVDPRVRLAGGHDG